MTRAPERAKVGAALSNPEVAHIARKPNYAFERMERERLKAARNAEKAEAKRQAREAEQAGDEPRVDAADDNEDGPGT